LLVGQVPCVALGRGKEKVGHPVDRNPIVFLGPRVARIMAPQSRLHMCKANAGVTRGQRTAKGAGRIALHDEQLGRRHRKEPPQRGSHQLGVEQRVGLAGTAERGGGKARQIMVAQFQAGMLSGNEQSRTLAEIGESLGDWAQLDGFRASSDDERDT
jgi:hypothetical protein